MEELWLPMLAVALTSAGGKGAEGREGGRDGGREGGREGGQVKE